MQSIGELATKETLEVEIERLLPGGVGLAHAEGLTLFVSLAAPGDLVRIKIDRVQGKLGFASILEIVKPSSARIEPPCPYFGLCGGCDFQQLTYQAQLDAKVEIIRDCLHRIAKIESPSNIQIHPSPNQWRYRARAMWQVDALRSRLGYFVRGSNEVCDVEYCAVLVPELQETLERIRIAIRNETAGQLRDIEAVMGNEGVSVAPEIAGFKTQSVSRVIGNETYHFSAEAFFQINHELLEPLIAEALRDIPLDVKEDGKRGTAIDLYCGVGLFTVPLARRFARVVGVEANELAAKFARRNLESVQRGNSPTVREGVSEPPALAGGFIDRGSSPGSSPTVREGVSEPPALAGGLIDRGSSPGSSPTVREGFSEPPALAGGFIERGSSPTVREGFSEFPALAGAEIVTARVGDWLKQHERSLGPVDFLLLDPPRTGAENRDIAGILALRPRQICYVSCDPATLARDLKKLLAAGYSLDSVVAFDMFPQTHHVETVVHLSATCAATI